MKPPAYLLHNPDQFGSLRRILAHVGGMTRAFVCRYPSTGLSIGVGSVAPLTRSCAEREFDLVSLPRNKRGFENSHEGLDQFRGE
jgi:hypothetical protein